MTDDKTDLYEQARLEAEERVRTFLWHEGTALRLPVENGYVTLEEAVPVLIAAYRRVLEGSPEDVLREAFDAGGPAPAERRAEAVDALVQAAVEAAKPQRRRIVPDLLRKEQTRATRPLLRVAPDPDDAVPGQDADERDGAPDGADGTPDQGGEPG